MTPGELSIRALQIDDAADLSGMLSSQSTEYARFFTPFLFDEESIRGVLAHQGLDVFMGLYWEKTLVGFFMLRGWNEGYEIPTFGIIIHEQYRGYGLEMISLETAKVICKLRQSFRIMIKMHPNNISSKGVARKTGFTLVGQEADGGKLIYQLELRDSRTTR